jgi:hypothetical protein
LAYAYGLGPYGATLGGSTPSVRTKTFRELNTNFSATLNNNETMRV